MRGRTRRLFRKEKTSEEKTPFFKKKVSQTRENASPGFFSASGIQAKLKMGKAGDTSEKQADAVADRVVSSPGRSGLLQRDPLDSSIRKASEDKKDETAAKFEVQKAEEEEKGAAKFEVQKAEEEEASAKFEVQKAEEDEGSAKLEVQKAEDEEASARFELQRAEDEEASTKLEVQKAEEEETSAKFELNKAEDEEASTKLEVKKVEDEEVSSKHLIQRKEENKSNNTFETRLKAAKSGGRPLPDRIKEEMEHRMGKDFSKVLIHTDDTAIALCSEIKAQAFTNGYHIFFNKGKFQPDSKFGKHLLAHELTHVVQQKM